MIRGTAALVILVGLQLCLSACSSATRTDGSTTAVPVATLKYQTRAQARSAALSIYTRYLAAADAVSSAGGDGVERLADYVTSDELKQEQASAAELKKRKVRIVGSSRLVKFTLQEANLASGLVSAYSCVDFSKARVLNQTGTDVTPAKRLDRQTSVARFVWEGEQLQLAEISAWSGDSLC